MNTQELDALFGKRSPQAQLEADTDALMFRFLSIVDRLMDDRGISKRALAEKIGTSPAFVTQLFRGHKTINLETLAKMQAALGIQFSVGVEGLDTQQDSLEDLFLEDASHERQTQEDEYPWQGDPSVELFTIVA